MIYKLNYKKCCVIVLIFILFVLLFVFFIARINVKKELASYPFDVTEKGYLYSYGLGVMNSDNWLGRVKTKFTLVYPSGKLWEEVFYDRDGEICRVVKYHDNGQIAMISPMSRDKSPRSPGVPRSLLVNDGLTQSFYDNGQLEMESGSRPGKTAPIDQHGVHREYSRKGEVISSQYFIADKECTKDEWENWLKKHPEDIKYSMPGKFRWDKYVIVGVATLMIVGLITFMRRCRIKKQQLFCRV